MVPLAHLALAWSCSPRGVFLSSRFSSQAQSGLAKPCAELSNPVRSYAELRLEDSPAFSWQTSRAAPCFAVPGQARASGQGWMLPRVSTQWWARREIAPAKVASRRGSRNNTCKQEVISRGKRLNGSVTWHCTKTQPRAAAASWGGCRARGDAWEAVPCRAAPGAPTAEPCLQSWGWLRRGLP